MVRGWHQVWLVTLWVMITTTIGWFMSTTTSRSSTTRRMSDCEKWTRSSVTCWYALLASSCVSFQLVFHLQVSIHCRAAVFLLFRASCGDWREILGRDQKLVTFCKFSYLKIWGRASQNNFKGRRPHIGLCSKFLVRLYSVSEAYMVVVLVFALEALGKVSWSPVSNFCAVVTTCPPILAEAIISVGSGMSTWLRWLYGVQSICIDRSVSLSLGLSDLFCLGWCKYVVMVIVVGKAYVMNDVFVVCLSVQCLFVCPGRLEESSLSGVRGVLWVDGRTGCCVQRLHGE